MVPKEQLDAFVLTISEAFGYAAEGWVPRGYLLLRDGLHTAQESAMEWTPELTALWETGL